MSWCLLIASGSLSGLASILLRLAATQSASVGSLGPMLLHALAVGSYGVGFVLYATALKRINLGAAYPFMVGVSILLLLGFTSLYEHTVKASHISGAVLVLAGIWLVSR